MVVFGAFLVGRGGCTAAATAAALVRWRFGGGIRFGCNKRNKFNVVLVNGGGGGGGGFVERCRLVERVADNDDDDDDDDTKPRIVRMLGVGWILS